MIAVFVSAQNLPDSVLVKTDTFELESDTSDLSPDSLGLNQKKLPRFYISLDVIKPFSYATNFRKTLEAGLGSRFYKGFGWCAYAGMAEHTPIGYIKNGSYTSEGSWFRTGPYYVLSKAAGRYRVAGQLLYAIGNFDAAQSFEVRSPYFEDLIVSYETKDISITWVELVLSSEQVIKESAYSVGTDIRIKFFRQANSPDDFDFYLVPGYGNFQFKALPAFNVFIKRNF